MESELNSSGKIETSLPSTTIPSACPSVEDIFAWLENQDQMVEPAWVAHVRKCPRCGNLLEAAAAQNSDAGMDVGFADQDLLSLQPGLHLPTAPVDAAAQGSASGKVKPSAAKVPATTWELLSGRPQRSRKS